MRARTVVIATGTRPAAGGLRAAENVIIGLGWRVESRDYRGRAVAILGGGDNAFENYGLVMAKGASRVHIYARTLRAWRQLLEAVPPGNVFLGDYRVDQDTGTVDGRRYDVLIALYGWEPWLPFLDAAAPARDARGFLVTDSDCETTVPGLYAVGEVANRMHPCCATAMADGVVAAKAIQRRLERGAQARFAARTRRTRAGAAPEPA